MRYGIIARRPALRFFIISFIFLALGGCGAEPDTATDRAASTTRRSPASLGSSSSSATACSALQARVNGTFTACGSAASNPIVAQILGESCTTALRQMNVAQCEGAEQRIARAITACRPAFNQYKNWLKTQCRQALEVFLGPAYGQ